MRFPGAAIGVDFDFYRLPRTHVGQLCLLKVGRNPDILKRYHFYQFLSDADVLAHLDCLLAYDSCDWRTNDCITEVKLRLIELCLAFWRLGIGCVRLGARHRNLLRRGL